MKCIWPKIIEVNTFLKNRGLKVGPVLEDAYFDKLLDKVTEENRHDLVDFGNPHDQEVW